MSALGDYIHLTKSNYDKYGILRDGGLKMNEGAISKQIGEWQRVHGEYSSKFTNTLAVKDPIEEQFKKHMKGYKTFLKGLENSSSAKRREQKEEILKEVLGDFYEFLRSTIQINLATGAVSQTGSTQSILDADVVNVIRKMSTNKSRVSMQEVTRKNVSSIDIKHFLDKCIKECDEYFNFLNKKSTLSKNKIQENEIKYNAFRTKIDELMNKIPKRYQLTDARFLNLDSNLKALATELVNILDLLKVPSLNSLKGKVSEVCLQKFYQQGTAIGVKTAVDTIGSQVTQGNYNVQFFAPAAKEIENLIKSSKTNLTVSQQPNDEDKIVQAILSYNYSSQRKADVIVQLDIESDDPHFNTKGISVKNYTSDTVHLVSGSPLLLFLLGGELSMDQVNHYINLFAESTMSNDIFNAVSLNSAKDAATAALKLMILYAAASGENVGKGVDNIADYLLLNAPDKGDEGGLYIVSIKKLIGYIVKKEIGFQVATSSDMHSDLRNISFTNKYIPGDNPDEAAGKRIANLIMKIHQTKIYVAIPRTAIMSASSLI